MNAVTSDESVLRMESSWGVLVVKSRNALITAFFFFFFSSEPHEKFEWGRSDIKANNSRDEAVLRKAERFVRGLFGGKESPSPELDWPKASVFTVSVWKGLAAIPKGQTAEYGELARTVGCPGGARAVGRACGANPLPLFIPCHRAVARHGTLGGFSCGLPWKRLLLEVEKTV